jgi:hypothetical protein
MQAAGSRQLLVALQAAPSMAGGMQVPVVAAAAVAMQSWPARQGVIVSQVWPGEAYLICTHLSVAMSQNSSFASEHASPALQVAPKVATCAAQLVMALQ